MVALLDTAMYDRTMLNTTITADKATLARKLASALNFSFEAHMNEYSMDSLDMADADRTAALAEASANGFNKDDLVENVGGTWRSIA